MNKVYMGINLNCNIGDSFQLHPILHLNVRLNKRCAMYFAFHPESEKAQMFLEPKVNKVHIFEPLKSHI